MAIQKVHKSGKWNHRKVSQVKAVWSEGYKNIENQWFITFRTEPGNTCVLRLCMTDEYIAKLLCPQNVTLWPTSWWQACDFSLFFSLWFASLLSVWKQGESHRRNLQGRRRNHQSLGRSQQNQERILACQIRYQNNSFRFLEFVIYYKSSLLCIFEFQVLYILLIEYVFL